MVKNHHNINADEFKEVAASILMMHGSVLSSAAVNDKAYTYNFNQLFL